MPKFPIDKWEVVDDVLHFPEPPEINGQLIIEYAPTREWLKQNKHLKPIMNTNLVAFQKDYLLPADFKFIITKIYGKID